MQHAHTLWFLLSLGAALCAAPALAAGGEALGYVSSMAGEATAQRAGETPRPLACGDPVFSDDTLRTAADSRVGVMLDDELVAHLSSDTRVVLGRTAGAAPAATLEAGKVRVIDPREAGAPARLAALDAAAQVAGNDAEAYVFAEKVGPYAMLCEWDEPLAVARGAEPAKVAQPGECVIAKPAEPLYIADAHDVRIPAAPEEVCPFEVVAGPPQLHLTPADVAAPGPVAGPALQALAFQGPGFLSCEGGGAGCALPLPVVAEPGQGVGGPPVPGDAGSL